MQAPPGEDRPALAVTAPFCVLVCGEPGSGKSTLINALFRSQAIAPAADSPWRHTQILRHVDRGAGVQYFGTDGGRVSGPSQAVYCEIGVKAPHLRGIDVIEVPYCFEGAIGEDAISLMRDADMVIWVSIASQAWRLSEKAVLERLGPGMAARTVLALSRADKLREASDESRVGERLRREAGDHASEFVFMHGAPRLIEASAAGSEAAWEQSGGRALLDLIDRARSGVPRLPPLPLAEVAAEPAPAQPDEALPPPRVIPREAVAAAAEPVSPVEAPGRADATRDPAAGSIGRVEGALALDPFEEELAALEAVPETSPEMPVPEAQPETETETETGADIEAAAEVEGSNVIVLGFGGTPAPGTAGRRPVVPARRQRRPVSPLDMGRPSGFISDLVSDRFDEGAGLPLAPREPMMPSPLRVAEVTGLLSSLDGVEAAGLACAEEGRLLAELSPAAELPARRCAMAVWQLMCAQAPLTMLLTPRGGEVEETVITLQRRVVVILGLPGCDGLLYLVLRQGGSNVALARSLLARAARLLDGND